MVSPSTGQGNDTLRTSVAHKSNAAAFPQASFQHLQSLQGYGFPP